MKAFVIICGAVIAALSAVLMLVEPAALFGVVVGVLLILYGRKGKREQKSQKALLETKRQASVVPPNPSALPAEPVPEQSVVRPVVRVTTDVPYGKKKTIKVAGISHYTDAVLSLGYENPDYDLTKEEIIESGLEDVEIPMYDFNTMDVEFVEEPDNPYDSEAIAIYVEGIKIGHVSREDNANIRKMINSGTIISTTCEIVGGKFKIYNSVTNEIEKTNLNYGARVTLTIQEPTKKKQPDKCPVCGQPCQTGAHFCTSCGAKL